jgi:transposase
MTRTDLRTYTPEFRAEAVKLVLEQRLSQEVAAQRLSVPKGTLANWVTAAKRGSTASTPAPGSRSVADLEAENARLRRELAVERMEKEVLKRPRPSLLRSRCPVRAIEDDATRLSYCATVPRV